MKPWRTRLPDLDAVAAQFDHVLASGYRDFLASTHTRRQAILGHQRAALLSALFAIAIFLFLYIVRESFGTLGGTILIGSAMVWLIIVLLSARQWLTNAELLAKEVNMALVPIISGTLDHTIVYAHDTAHREEAVALLAASELMTIKDISVIADDLFTIYHGATEIAFRELAVTQKVQTKSGKLHEVQLFKGVFVTAALPQAHAAKTFISTEGDRTGFAHRDFWADLLEHKEVKETVFEWNDFESLLHVASTDPKTARELLDPQAMTDVYDWWQEHKLNMRMSFIDNTFYLLLPEAKIEIGTSTRSAEVRAIRTYACSLLRPMWRTLVLLDDVLR